MKRRILVVETIEIGYGLIRACRGNDMEYLLVAYPGLLGNLHNRLTCRDLFPG